jgi:PAS domain S-box-containing protein
MNRPGSSINVLYVDSDAEFTDRVATFLEREDERFDVTVAGSVTAGLDSISRRAFDCVVSDHDVPETDGVAFLRTVREEHPKLPFVLYTGTGSEAVASDAISAGVTDYLRKGDGPERNELLANRIGNAVEQYRADRRTRKYRQIVRTMREAACVYDREGRFAVVNESLADFYGTTRQALEGRKSDLLDSLRESNEGDPYRELIEGEREELSGEVVGEFRGQEEATVEYRLTRLVIDGEVLGSVGIGRDVTEERRRARELERTTARYEALLENFPDGAVFQFDEAHRYTVAAGRELARVGLCPDDVEGTTPRDLFPPDIAEETAAYYDRALDGVDEVVEQRDVGEPYRIRTLPIRDEDGEVIAGMAVSQNVTQAKERERELEAQNERLEEFASVVSHDLRNPVSVAMGRAELLREDCDSPHLDHVEDALSRTNRIIDDMLWLAREGRDIGATEAVPLGEAVEHAWTMAADDSPDATLAYRGEGSVTVAADRERLVQALENLFRNAVDHGGPEVTVRVEPTAPGFAVEDDGPGIPPDEREAVFEAGYSTSADGTGFGLSIVERIAEAHGWGVTVTEGESGGARFEFAGVDAR